MTNGKLTVLLVDDEPEVLEISAKLLDRSDMLVLRAKNYNEALDAYAANISTIDVILTDVNYGKGLQLNGPDFIRKIKAGAFILQPIIFTSGQLGSYMESDLVELSGNPILYKPACREEMLEAIKSAVTKWCQQIPATI